VGGLLLASALLRSAIGASEALAKGEPDPGAAPAPVVAEPAAVVAEADILPLLAALDAREARLDRRAEEIAVRMQALTLAEEEIAQKLAALEEAEQALRATLALARTAAEDDLTRLTEVYANMKPKQAAALFEQMDPDFAAGFLSRMQPGAAAAIMAGMTPETAYLVSVIVAGRNAEVPRD
jgi:flagellar motility protein MotE (MotC chaperone)